MERESEVLTVSFPRIWTYLLSPVETRDTQGKKSKDVNFRDPYSG